MTSTNTSKLIINLDSIKVLPFLILFISILFSNCHQIPDHTNTLKSLKNTVWIDSLCNEYHFKDSIVRKGGLFKKASPFDPTGKLHLNKEIELHFNFDDGETIKYRLESHLNHKLCFKSSNPYDDSIILFKRDTVEKTGLQLEILSIKITPLSKTSLGLSEITITKDKKIEYKRIENNNILEVATLSESTFYQIEQYLEILKFNNYEDTYKSLGFDGTNYELNLKTNLYSKTIKCTQSPTEGIGNLITLIDFKLQFQ
jgi:hypothetical protein